MVNKTDQLKPSADKTSSLLDRQARGGSIAIQGFNFQSNYALILLIQSLRDPLFKRLMVEGAEDVDADLGQRTAIQIKNHEINTSDVKKIIEQFQNLDKASPKTWKSFVIICTGLDPKISSIHAQLEIYRDKRKYYDIGDGILINTANDLKGTIIKAGLPPEFVMEKVSFEPDLNVYQKDDVVQAWAKDILHGMSPKIDFEGLENVYLHLVNMVKEYTGKVITRSQIQDVIDSELRNHTRIIIEPNQDVNDLLKLFTQHAAFMKVDYTGGDPTAMFAAIRRTRFDMGAKTLFMLSQEPLAEKFREVQQQLYMLESETWELFPMIANLADTKEINELDMSDRKKKVRAILGEQVSDEASQFLRRGAVHIRQSVEKLVLGL